MCSAATVRHQMLNGPLAPVQQHRHRNSTTGHAASQMRPETTKFCSGSRRTTLGSWFLSWNALARSSGEDGIKRHPKQASTRNGSRRYTGTTSSGDRNMSWRAHKSSTSSLTIENGPRSTIIEVASAKAFLCLCLSFKSSFAALSPPPWLFSLLFHLLCPLGLSFGPLLESKAVVANVGRPVLEASLPSAPVDRHTCTM